MWACFRLSHHIKHQDHRGYTVQACKSVYPLTSQGTLGRVQTQPAFMCQLSTTSDIFFSLQRIKIISITAIFHVSRRVPSGLVAGPGPPELVGHNSTYRPTTMKMLFFHFILSVCLSSANSLLTPFRVLPPQPALVSGILSGPSAAKYGPFRLEPGYYMLFAQWVTPGIWTSIRPLFFYFLFFSFLSLPLFLTLASQQTS